MTANSKLIGKMLRNQVAVTVLESVTSCLGLLFCAVIVGQHVGSDALVAFQLILPLAMVIIAAAGLIYNGGSISCSKYLGEGDFQKVNSNYTMITITGAVGSIAVMVACLLFAEPLAVILGASDHIHEMTVDIIRCLGLMGLPFILFQVNLYYFKMDNDQRICVVSALSYMVTVVGFALFFSMFTDLGLLGIGFALDISSYIAWGVSLLHFRNPDRFLKFVKPIDMKNDFLSAMRAGLPTTVNRAAYSVRVYFMNTFLLAIAGYTAVKAFSVQNNVGEIILCVSLGYGFITATMCGMFFGERDRNAVAETLKQALKSGILVSFVLSAAIFWGADIIVGLFISDVDPTDAIEALRTFAFTSVTTTVSFIFVYFYQSIGNYRASNLISLMRGFPFLIGSALLLQTFFGLDGVWLSFQLADLQTTALIILYVWYKHRRFPRSLADYIVCDERVFEADVILDESIGFDEQAAKDLCEKARSLCTAKNDGRSDRAISYMEELLSDMIAHDPENRKGSSIDVRIFTDEEGFKFRIRNDDAHYDPFSYIDGDREWIDRMRSIPTSIKYRYAVNMNNYSALFA